MLELSVWRGSRWQRVATLPPGKQTISMSDNTGPQREVYLAWCVEDDSCSVLARSCAGLDTLIDPNLRQIDLTTLEEIAHLNQDEAHEMMIQPDGHAIPHRVRFRHIIESE